MAENRVRKKRACNTSCKNLELLLLRADCLRLMTRCLSLFVITILVPMLPAAAAETYTQKGVLYPPPSATALSNSDRSAYWATGFNAVFDTLLYNLQMPEPPFSTRYAQPGPAWPKDVFLWDTAFISQEWRLWDDSTAREINRAVLDHALNGMLRHVFSADEQSDETQPPVMAWAVWRLYKKDGDLDYLKYAYPVLVDYNKWLYENRRLENGLFFWRHPYESGIDNSPRFTNREVSKIRNMRRIAAIDMSSFIVLQNDTLAKMANELGRNEDAAKFAGQADALRKLINDLLWDEKDSVYYDLDLDKQQMIRVKTVSSLFPLFCSIPDRAQAKRMLDVILDPHIFNTPMPLPTTALDQEEYFLDMWRGPVWINTSYMVIVGLQQYGFKDAAADLAFRTVDWVYRYYSKSGELWEFYDPEQFSIERLHRKTNILNYGTMKDKPRTKFIGWTGLVNNLVVEQLLGIDKDDKSWRMCPHFPVSAGDLELRITFPRQKITAEIHTRADGALQSQLETADGVFPLQADGCAYAPLAK